MLAGYVGEVLSVGFDFATAPLSEGELTTANDNGALSARVVGDDGLPRSGGVIAGPTISGTVVTATIKPIASDAYFVVTAPASDGNVYIQTRALGFI